MQVILPVQTYLLVNGQEVDIRFFHRKQKYKSTALIANASGPSTAMDKSTADKNKSTKYV